MQLDRFAFDPADSARTRLEKAAIALVAGSCCLAGVVWALMYLAVLGPVPTTALPAAYAIVVGAALVISHRRRSHWPAVYAQIVCIIYVTTLIQWSIGGLFDSGFVMAWAFCGPITALLFFSVRGSLVWFALYTVNVVLTVVFDDAFAAHGLGVGTGVRALFFVMNLVVSSGVVFALAAYFVTGKTRAEAQLAASHAELVASQQALVQSEKLAALGQLVAGIAHELNTPLGAISASTGNLDQAVGETLFDLPRTLCEASDDDRERLRALVAAAGRDTRALTSREERARRAALQERLEAAGIADARQGARLLVQLGVGDDVDAHLALLRSERAGSLLRGARTLGAFQRNTVTIRTAVERASKIVFALKTYAHPGAARGTVAEGSVAAHLETVLTLYQHQLEHGMEVVRRFDDPGVLLARHEELNQVWTNLVHNALQAMNNRGRLELAVRADGAGVRVEVVDSGPGIPDDVKARMFTPFFTTKARGEGSGLGLSISKDIVDAHGGRFEVDSAPGRTCVAVWLPRAPPEGSGPGAAGAAGGKQVH